MPGSLLEAGPAQASRGRSRIAAFRPGMEPIHERSIILAASVPTYPATRPAQGTSRKAWVVNMEKLFSKGFSLGVIALIAITTLLMAFAPSGSIYSG